MKVLLVGNYAPDKQESMQRFSAMLETELRALGHDVRTVRPLPRFNRRGAGAAGVAKWLGYADKFLWFPALLKRAARHADIVHICDHSNAPYAKYCGQTPHLVTCHDVLAIVSALGLVPQNPTGATGKLLQRFILRGLNRAQFVACDSEKTREQLLEVSTLAPAQLDKVLVGFNYPYSPMPALQSAPLLRALLPQIAGEAGAIKPYILHVGGNQWYKNRQGVLKIYGELRELMGEQTPALVMAGKAFTGAMNALVEQLNLNDVHAVCDVSNEQLRALYSRAQLLVFPSLAEGFGWPIIEAQACGCRVLTTGAAPMNEVGGDAAFYADAHDKTEFARVIKSLLEQNSTERAASVERSLNNIERFDPRVMAQRYAQIYREQCAKQTSN